MNPLLRVEVIAILSPTNRGQATPIIEQLPTHYNFHIILTRGSIHHSCSFIAAVTSHCNNLWYEEFRPM